MAAHKISIQEGHKPSQWPPPPFPISYPCAVTAGRVPWPLSSFPSQRDTTMARDMTMAMATERMDQSPPFSGHCCRLRLIATAAAIETGDDNGRGGGPYLRPPYHCKNGCNRYVGRRWSRGESDSTEPNRRMSQLWPSLTVLAVPLPAWLLPSPSLLRKRRLIAIAAAIETGDNH